MGSQAGAKYRSSSLQFFFTSIKFRFENWKWAKKRFADMISRTVLSTVWPFRWCGTVMPIERNLQSYLNSYQKRVIFHQRHKLIYTTLYIISFIFMTLKYLQFFRKHDHHHKDCLHEPFCHRIPYSLVIF